MGGTNTVDEPGIHLTPAARRAVEDGLGFRPNPGRGNYYGRGAHHGKHFRLVPDLGLSYEDGRHSYEIPASAIRALASTVEEAFAGGEYDEYRRKMGTFGDGDPADEFLCLAALALCLEEDSVMYLLLQHAIDALDEAETSDLVLA